MRKFSEIILEQKSKEIDNYILEDYRILAECYYKSLFRNSQIDKSFIFEELSQLDNFIEIFNLVYNFIENNVDKFDDEQQYTINVSKANSFFKYVVIRLFNSNNLFAKYDKSTTKGEKIYIDLYFTKDWQEKIFNITGLFLHELLHAYEDINRKISGKPSIFDELSTGYVNAIINLNHPNENIKQISILKYFFNDKERRAYISTLELDIDKVVKSSKISITNFKPSKILDKLKKDTIWKKYFNFAKFIAIIDNIDDNKIRSAYYQITREIKKPNEIRKECKVTFEKFNRKFSEAFIKTLGKYIENNAQNKYVNMDF